MEEIKCKFPYGGTSDYGSSREVNEDFLAFEPLREDILLAVIADGAGSKQCGFSIQPAVIAATEIVKAIRRLYTYSPEFLESYAAESLMEAMSVANTVIGAFKVANEENYSGFGICITCCLVVGEKFFIAHCGNTRAYLIRHADDGSARIIQLTHDHTLARRMVLEGTLAEDEYYSHPARYTYTSGLGFVTEPEIQTYAGSLKYGDLIAMTTDGIHYAIRPEAICDIIVKSDNWNVATKSLIEGAKLEKMQDNMTAAVIYDI